MKTKIFFIIFVILGLSGCFSIKSKYPEVQYYKLEQIKSILKTVDTVSGTLQVREFTTTDDLETVHLNAIWGNNTVQQYFYHRWTSDCGQMITDFIIQKFNQMDAFKGGVVKPTSTLSPDYFLEGQILEFIAYSSDKDLGSNYVSISMQISLLKRDQSQVQPKLIFNKVYSLKVSRDNKKVESIAPAMSIGVSKISDLMLNDIIASIRNNKLNNK